MQLQMNLNDVSTITDLHYLQDNQQHRQHVPEIKTPPQPPCNILPLLISAQFLSAIKLVCCGNFFH